MAIQVEAVPAVAHGAVSDSNGTRAGSVYGPGLKARAERLTRGLSGWVTVGPGPREMIEVHAPFTGECIATVPACTPEDVALAEERGRRAQQAWMARPLAERCKIFLRYHDLILERREHLLDLVQIEVGKARRHAMEEVFEVALNARYYAYHASEYLRPRRRQGLLPLFTEAWEYRHPVGLVGVIAPWNYPLVVASSDAIPALIAGNPVIVKPAERTPLSALYVASLLYEAGLPGDLYQVLTGRGRAIGASIVEHSCFIQFTGSTEVGRTVHEQAGRKLMNASLELGGKNAMIVLDDADLGRTVHGAIQGCFGSTGQLCVSFERLYVQRGIYDEFMEELVRRTKALRLGSALDYSVDVGSIIDGGHLAKIFEHIDDAVSKGATILAGGRKRPDVGPYFMEPTILTDVTPGMKCYDQETFGPVVAVYPVDTAEEALAKANDSDYGLNASIWTRNVRRGRELAQRVQAGTVNINESYAATWSSLGAPMGGMKASGLGRRHGAEGIQKFTEAQNISVAGVTSLVMPFQIDFDLGESIYAGLFRVLKHVPGLR